MLAKVACKNTAKCSLLDWHVVHLAYCKPKPFLCSLLHFVVQMQPDSSVKRVPGLSDFKLPSTFYMTQYRRLAADAMR